MKKNLQVIDQEIESVFQHLQSKVRKDQVVIREKLPKKSHCSKAIIGIYNRADIAKSDSKSIVEPIARFVFYSGNLNPKKLGSVAIYGADVLRRYSFLRKGNNFFGHHILNATIQYGRRPFLDIKLAP